MIQWFCDFPERHSAWKQITQINSLDEVKVKVEAKQQHYKFNKENKHIKQKTVSLMYIYSFKVISDQDSSNNWIKWLNNIPESLLSHESFFFFFWHRLWNCWLEQLQNHFNLQQHRDSAVPANPVISYTVSKKKKTILHPSLLLPSSPSTSISY